MAYGITDALKDISRLDLKLVTQSIKDYRMGLCTSCTFYTPYLRQCQDCHCLVDGKTWLEKSSCPKGKW